MPDLGFRNRRFKTLLFVSRNTRFTRGKRDFSRSAPRSRRASRNVVILAQILVHEPASHSVTEEDAGATVFEFPRKNRLPCSWRRYGFSGTSYVAHDRVRGSRMTVVPLALNKRVVNKEGRAL